mmetsp:Transcript_14184/g.36229  ORF Transcript_14184/g.36229 Transcript_14184/m.36229 type:complete len:855 (-) Transcript_14184:59-2623(-)|eukprot:CAMPEP_0177657510 /NCGR_PEP_ID=MMETSP0447-20121125/16235_1 /TAXON_ID=0 /ORGANISM="Stygamoeba regulata, Strain BSH-02190019" /LENGTH=854 /DNA_ID=CAMNT_0019161893 /DNA_START=189 /DNA_END=2753 /DNA_ORIENTATION=+
MSTHAIALYDCIGEGHEELSFTRGDTIALVSRPAREWWVGELNGRRGLVPLNFVVPIGEGTASSPFPPSSSSSTPSCTLVAQRGSAETSGTSQPMQIPNSGSSVPSNESTSATTPLAASSSSPTQQSPTQCTVRSSSEPSRRSGELDTIGSPAASEHVVRSLPVGSPVLSRRDSSQVMIRGRRPSLSRLEGTSLTGLPLGQVPGKHSSLSAREITSSKSPPPIPSAPKPRLRPKHLKSVHSSQASSRRYPSWWSRIQSSNGKLVTFSEQEIQAIEKILERDSLLACSSDDSDEDAIYLINSSPAYPGANPSSGELSDRNRMLRAQNKKIRYELSVYKSKVEQLELEKASLVKKVAEMTMQKMMGALQDSSLSSSGSTSGGEASSSSEGALTSSKSSRMLRQISAKLKPPDLSNMRGVRWNRSGVTLNPLPPVPLSRQRQVPLSSRPDCFFGPEGPTLHHKLPRYKLSAPRPSYKAHLSLTGPTEEQDGEYKSLGDLAFGVATSSYPRVSINPSRDGTPICDFYRFDLGPERIVACLTDGCNWGQKPRDAARVANNRFCSYLQAHMQEADSVQKAGQLVLYACEEAHRAILEQGTDVWSVGKTTILGGMVIPIQHGEDLTDAEAYFVDPVDNTREGLVFVFGGVGDCKFYLIDHETGACKDMCLATRSDHMDPCDPGGRIGPYHDDGSADIRNLSVSCCFVHPGDIIVLCSDGIHDNFDPQIMGLDPKDCNVDSESWEALDPLSAISSKAEFSESYVAKELASFAADGSLSPSKVGTFMATQAWELSQAGRNEMESHPSVRLPQQYKLYPGKMDHVSAICFRCSILDLGLDSSDSPDLELVIESIKRPPPQPIKE